MPIYKTEYHLVSIPRCRRKVFVKGVKEYAEKLLSHVPELDPDIDVVNLNVIGIRKILGSLLSSRKFEFDVEWAIFLTVLHRLFVSGSDRGCDKWRRDYIIEGVVEISLHHLYRAMTYLGEEIEDQKDKTLFAPHCTKDVIEGDLFHLRRYLFSGLDGHCFLRYHLSLL